MGPGDLVQLMILVILLILSAFFSSAETALMTCNKIRMRSLAEDGNTKAARLLKITDEPGKLLSAILIGNNVVNLSASSLATIFATNVLGKLWGPGVAAYGAGIATGVLTLLVLVFGEISPKTLAAVHADGLALAYVPVIGAVMWVLTPFIWITNFLSRGLLRLLRVNPDEKVSSMTEEELRTIVDVSHEEGILEESEMEMINNVVDFGDARAKDIMVPRVDMTVVDVDATYEELLDCFRENRFTRIPVYEESRDNIIGIINMKDVLLYRPDEAFDVRDFLRKPHFTFENKKLGEMLSQMRESSVNITIVLDEYGVASGLITLEDLLEEIVGEIRDEYDEEEKDNIQKISDTEYLVEGAMKLDDVNDSLDLLLESEDYDSLGGLMIQLLDRLPQGGETVTYRNIVFTVEQVKKNRVEKVRMVLPASQETENTEKNDASEEEK